MSLQYKRAAHIFSKLNKLIEKSEKHNAKIFYDGCPIPQEDIIMEANDDGSMYCGIKASETVRYTIFDIESKERQKEGYFGSTEILYDTIPQLDKWFECRFKLYKEIKV